MLNVGLPWFHLPFLNGAGNFITVKTVVSDKYVLSFLKCGSYCLYRAAR